MLTDLGLTQVSISPIGEVLGVDDEIFDKLEDIENEKATPRWEQAEETLCPECASIIELHIVSHGFGEKADAERCTSCHWSSPAGAWKNS